VAIFGILRLVSASIADTNNMFTADILDPFCSSVHMRPGMHGGGGRRATEVAASILGIKSVGYETFASGAEQLEPIETHHGVWISDLGGHSWR
jgi:hypothetical protein